MNSGPYHFSVLLVLVRLEPILAEIKRDRTVVACPIIDAIDDFTLAYSLTGGYNVGGFTWSGHFTWRDVPEEDKLHRAYTDPVRYLSDNL